MQTENRLTKIAFLLLVLLFCISMAHLFRLRFKSGDIYPPYSSFRADPLGTKALYDAFDHLKGVKASRSFVPIAQYPGAVPPDTATAGSTAPNTGNTCLILAGVVSGTRLFIPGKTAEGMQKLAESGYRLVIALTPDKVSLERESSSSEAHQEDLEKQPPDLSPTHDRPKETNDEKTDIAPQRVDLFKALGILVNIFPGSSTSQAASQKNSHNTVQQARSAAQHMPDPMPWQPALWFEAISPGWQTIFTIDQANPVVLEKKFTTGSMVLLADSYILSNESLKKESNAAFLAWLAEGRTKIVFDEYHLGVQKKAGISTLIHQYRLYGPTAFLLIFAVLLLWRQSSNLLPPDESDQDLTAPATGGPAPADRDHTSGLNSLLRQHIPQNEIIRQCMEAWKADFVKGNRAARENARRYEMVKTALAENKAVSKNRAIEEYKIICRTLSKKENS